MTRTEVPWLHWWESPLALADLIDWMVEQGRIEALQATQVLRNPHSFVDEYALMVTDREVSR